MKKAKPHEEGLWGGTEWSAHHLTQPSQCTEYTPWVLGRWAYSTKRSTDEKAPSEDSESRTEARREGAAPLVSVQNPWPGLKKRPRAQQKPDGWNMTEMEKLWKPGLGWPVRGHQDEGSPFVLCLSENFPIDGNLDEGIRQEIWPRNGQGIHHAGFWVWNWGHIHWQMLTEPSGEEADVRCEQGWPNWLEHCRTMCGRPARMVNLPGTYWTDNWMDWPAHHRRSSSVYCESVWEGLPSGC